ncbi:MAG: GLUG motif-containing protein, partial [Planctomycetota bacterium]
REFYSYWDIETSGLTVSQVGEGKTTFQMKHVETFLNWIAEPAIWTIDNGSGYPRLAWQQKEGQPVDRALLSQFLDGLGTQSEPYLISAEHELELIGGPYQEGIYYQLISDIDLSSRVYTQATIPLFSGVFDGGGFAVTSLTIDTAGVDSKYLGLFSNIGETGHVKSLGIEDANITGGTGSDYLGALAGRNDGTITDCFSNVTALGDDEVGGLVGDNWGAVIQCYSTGSIYGNSQVGGLAGLNRNIIINCYSTASVMGSRWGAGGLVGENWHTITNCYSIGRVIGNEHPGGLVGHDKDWVSISVNNSVWDIMASGQLTSAGGEGKATPEMQMVGTFLEAGWDFVDEITNGTEDIWWILEGQDYPRLWWEAQ